MRSRLGVGFWCAVMLAVAGGAQAAPMALDVTAKLRVHVGTQTGTQVVATSPVFFGTVTVDPMAGTLQIPAWLLSVQSLVVPLAPTFNPVTKVTVTAKNAAGTFSNGGGAAGACPGPIGGYGGCIYGGGFGGAMQLQGTVKVPSPVTTNILLSGAVGTLGTNVGAKATIQGAPWTTGTAAVTTPASLGWLTLIGTGAGVPGAPLSLVTPVFLDLDGSQLGVLLELQLNVPEPGTLLMLGGVAACVGLLKRRRARS